MQLCGIAGALSLPQKHLDGWDFLRAGQHGREPCHLDAAAGSRARPRDRGLHLDHIEPGRQAPERIGIEPVLYIRRQQPGEIYAGRPRDRVFFPLPTVSDPEGAGGAAAVMASASASGEA